jgi:hypothetical protein
MLHFTTDCFSYNSKTKIFVQETSTLDLSRQWWNSGRHTPVNTIIELKNPVTGNTSIFKFTHADFMPGPDREVAGWNYKDDNGIRLLLIND